jgi:hypothetical protein
MRRSRATILAGMGLAAIALAGCGNTDTGGMSEPMNVGSMDSGAVSSESVSSGSFDQKAADQYLTRNSSISLQGSDVSGMTSDVLSITTEFAGVISQQDIRNEGELSYSTLTVRVPDAELESYLDQLATVGEVTFLSTSTLDVTTTVIDLDSRIDTLNTSIATLTTLQADATSVADLVAVESELTARTAERDSLVAQREFLQDQVDLSTVYISISADPAATTDSPNFVQGIVDGWNALINTFAAIITFAGFLVPFIVALIAIVIVFGLIRTVLKRVRQRN